MITNVITLISALVGAFAGAWFAYKLQHVKEESELKKSQIAHLNEAMFGLFRQYSDLLNIKKNLDEFEAVPIRAFVMPSTIYYKSEIKFDSRNLSFILGTDNPDILAKLFTLNAKYSQALLTADMRSELHAKQIQPNLEKHQLVDRFVSIEELEDKLGKKLYVSAIKITDELFVQVNATIKAHIEFEAELFDFAKMLFPGEPDKKFIRFQ